VDQSNTPTDANKHQGLVDRLKGQATGQLSTQKDRASEGLTKLATAVRGTSQPFRDQKQDAIAEYVDKAATQIDRLASRIRERDLGSMVQDAERFARQRPALFASVAFTAGVLAARFLKSSAPHTGSWDRGGQARDYGSGQWRARESGYAPGTGGL